jgi:hypothetical protein
MQLLHIDREVLSREVGFVSQRLPHPLDDQKDGDQWPRALCRHNRRRNTHPDALAGGARPDRALVFCALDLVPASGYGSYCSKPSQGHNDYSGEHV